MKKGFDLIENTFYVQASEMGQLLPKTVLLHTMSHIQLNYAFLVFLKNFAEIDNILIFMD